jgi:hypothetical protein
MSSVQVLVILPVLIFIVMFAAVYINILLAKGKIRHWKKNTGLMFVHSIGMFGIARRSSLIWTERFGYDKQDADVLATCQSRAIFEMCVGVVVAALIAAHAASLQ